MLKQHREFRAVSYCTNNKGEIWENGSHNFHIRSGDITEDGTPALQQWEISIEYAGIYVHTRTRTSANASWGAWTSWKKVVSF